jgi:quinol monooxygenase YgiN
MIIRTGVFSVWPEKRDELVEAMMVWSKIARQMPGCLTHSFYADLGDAEKIRFYGEWESEEAQKATSENPRFADLWSVIKATGATHIESSLRTATLFFDDGPE